MKPFSENIIFFDTEFSSLNPYKGEILSMGLVKFGGEELYLELLQDCEIDPWVQKHVVPLLTEPKVTREEAVKKVFAFVGPGRPYMLAYVNQFDALYWYKLIGGVRDNAFHWIPIDFASILFAAGKDPQSFDWRRKESIIPGLGIDYAKYREHHALDDARFLREVYLKMLKK
ncbi:hypothetical protein HY250_04590 [Candidatus Azambacteria bacterium]|nr:hypothetical protein [Candidatus Azambacteria bacterium]